MKYDVFISYRRKEGRGLELARIIDEAIEMSGYRTFLDFNELNDSKFGPQIIAAIDSAPVFLFVLTEGSLDRCIEEDDWVRNELLYAIAKNKHIVPVNPEGKVRWNDIPKDIREKIPEGIRQALFDEQQSEIMLGQLFKQSVSSLVKNRIRPYVPRAIILKRFKQISMSLLCILLLSISLISLRNKQEQKNDYVQYTEWLKEAREQIRVNRYSKAAILLVNKSDSIYQKYRMTKYEYMFGTESKLLKDSLFQEHKKRVEKSYNRFLEDSTLRAQTREYLEDAMLLKSDSRLDKIKVVVK